MALTKETETETMDVQKDGSVILRERVAILEDGEELTHTFTQRTIRSADDLAGENEWVRQIGQAAQKAKSASKSGTNTRL